jgi:hypothetical protein
MRAARMLVRGRRLAEELMVDSCIIVSRSGGTVMNEETGEYEAVETAVYAGACKFSAGTVGVQEIDIQGQQRIEQEATLALPVDAPGSGDVDRDHVARITDCKLDPALVGVELRIVTPHRQSYATARRFRVEETR